MRQSRFVMIIMSTVVITFGVTTICYGIFEIYELNFKSTGIYDFPLEIPFESTPDPVKISKPLVGSIFGSISIPRLDEVVPIIEGSSEKELIKGVGHYVDSVLPGIKNNSVLAVDHDLVFRKIDKLKVGDLIIVNTKWGEFIYEVQRFRVVMADDNSAIVPTKDVELTLSTGFPFDHVGNAPMRFIAHSHLVSGNSL